MVCEACATANNDYMRAYSRAHYDPARRRAKYERDKARAAADRALYGSRS